MASAAGVKRELERSWNLVDLLEQAPGFAALSRTLAEITEAGAPVVALTGDLMYSNGLVRYGESFPERFFNMGIAEQSMVTTAAGMAASGLTPFVAGFASFLALLCCEQIRMDLAYSQLPVRLVGHHSGISLGFYGTSHHATEDLAVMRAIPGLTVICPADPASLGAAIRASVEWEEPIYLRIGRGREPEVYGDGAVGFEIGKAIKHFDGAAATVIATGSMVHPALAAVGALRAAGEDVGLIDIHTIKPFDRSAVLDAAAGTDLIVTVEEHNKVGGLGAAVAEVLAEAEGAPPLRRHGLGDEYSLIGPPTHLYRHYGLDAEGIEKFVRTQLEVNA